MIRLPPKKILVPVDLSELSYKAFAQAAQLAKAFSSGLEVLYVEAPPASELEPYAPHALWNKEYERKLTTGIRSRVGLGPSVALRQGFPAETILAQARRRHCDLIVMGTHGRSGLKRLLLGSVTEAVIRRSPTPVMAVHGRPQPLRSILAPVNFEPYSHLGLVYAAGLAAKLGAQLTALHVLEGGPQRGDPEEALSRLLDRLPDWVRRACLPRVLIKEGRAAEAIAKIAPRFDLIVLVAHRKQPLNSLLLGSTMEQILRTTPAPILAVPDLGPKVAAPAFPLEREP